MKKLLLVGLVAMMLAMSFVPTMAQYTTKTSFQVQNLSAQTANVQLMYYGSDGNPISGATFNDTINANSNKLYVQSNNTALTDGFNGSVVIASDQPVAAIGIQQSDNAAGTLKYQGTYGGFSATDAATKFYLPVVMKAYYGYTTEISVQNASTSNVDVVISYFSTGQVLTDTISGLKPGQVHRFNNANTPGMPATNYIGAATINATGNIVAVVNQNALAGTYLTKPQQQTYEGFSSANAGSILYAPVLMKAYYGFNTALVVQNVGTTSTDITVTFTITPGSSAPGSTLVRTSTLAPGAGTQFVQQNEAGLPARNWLGSAIVTSSGGQIVAIVNQQNTITGKAASYNAFSKSGTRYVGPNVMRNYYNFNTSVQVQNVGTSPTTCAAVFKGTATGNSNVNVTANSTTIQPGGTYLYVQQNQSDLGMGFVGAVDVTCGGQPFVVVINQNGPDGQGDNAMAYNGIPVQ